MTRLVPILLMLALAGCTPTPQAEPSPTWQLVTRQGAAVFVWCDDSPLEWCPSVRRGDEGGVLQPGGRIGGTEDVWDVRGVTVDAINLGE